jgi:hypothetical protein
MAKKQSENKTGTDHDELAAKLAGVSSIEAGNWIAFILQYGPLVADMIFQLLQRLQVSAKTASAPPGDFHCPEAALEMLHEAQHAQLDALCKLTCMMKCLGCDE